MLETLTVEENPPEKETTLAETRSRLVMRMTLTTKEKDASVIAATVESANVLRADASGVVAVVVAKIMIGRRRSTLICLFVTYYS